MKSLNILKQIPEQLLENDVLEEVKINLLRVIFFIGQF